MELIARKDCPEQERTFYHVTMDDGRTLKFERLHFPEWHSSKMFRHCGTDEQPCTPEDEVDALHYLRSVFPNDFNTAIFCHRLKIAYAGIFDACCSPEQAIYLAEQEWKEKKSDKNRWDYFYVKSGDSILRDWIDGAEENPKYM